MSFVRLYKTKIVPNIDVSYVILTGSRQIAIYQILTDNGKG